MRGRLSPHCPAELLSEIQRRQISGVLSFLHAGLKRQVFIDGGVTIPFAASSHPTESFTAHLADRARLSGAQVRAATEARQADEPLGITLVRLGVVPREQMAALTREHTHRVVRAVFAMNEGEWEFQSGALPSKDRIDPGLRIAELVLEWSRGLTDAAWTRQRLGLESRRIQRDRRPPEGYQSIRLDAAEGYIMSRVDGTATVNEIVMVSPMGEARTLAALLGLALAGILEMPREATLLAGVEAPRVTGTRAHGAAAAPPRPLRLVPPPATAAPTGKVPAAPAAPTGKAPTSAAGTTRAPAGPARPGATRPLRIGERRAVTPVRRPPPPAPKPAALPEGQQLEAEMMQRFEQIDALDLYQVLGVSSSAQADDIRRAYYALAQRFHPDRFRNEQSKPRAEKVFGRITEAYATLSNPESRRRYEEEEAGRAPARADSRPADTSDLARQNFRTGREHLDHGHLAEALGFLLNACQQDPTRAEYFELLGITQSRNPRMRKDAEASLLKAIALDPASASAHAHLGALYERTGAVDRAREMYRKALEWDSDNALARQGLERADPGRKGILGLFTRKS